MGTGAYLEEIGKNRKCFFDPLGGWIGLKFLVLAWSYVDSNVLSVYLDDQCCVSTLASTVVYQ